jgi:hypothetical protein
MLELLENVSDYEHGLSHLSSAGQATVHCMKEFAQASRHQCLQRKPSARKGKVNAHLVALTHLVLEQNPTTSLLFQPEKPQAKKRW